MFEDRSSLKVIRACWRYGALWYLYALGRRCLMQLVGTLALVLAIGSVSLVHVLYFA